MLSVPSGPNGFRKVRISVPRIDCLLDNSRYYLPGDQPPLDEQDRRGISRPQVGALGPAARPVNPPQRRGAAWTSHDGLRSRRRREQRDLNELAKLLGDPV